MTRRVVLVLALLAALIAGSAAGASAQTGTNPPSAKRQAQIAFKQLLVETRHVPRKAIKKKAKRRLVRIARRAKRTSLRRPCRTVKTLKLYRRGLRKIHEPRVRSFEPSGTTIRGTLESVALRANVTLLQLPRAKKCGGGQRPSVTETAPRVLESDETHLRMQVSLPSPTFSPHKIGGTVYQQMFMEGMGEGGSVGQPGLPQLTHFYGVPDGASVNVVINGTQGYDLNGVNLFPHQPQPVDALQLPPGAPDFGTFEDKPFEKDGGAYRSNLSFPPKASQADGLGTIRGVGVGGVDFAGGQYKPKSDKLHIFTSLDVTVEFGGGNQKTFGSAGDVNGKWDSRFLDNYGVLDNLPAVQNHLAAATTHPFCGEELLVITSPANEAAANTFADAKRAQGFLTRVKLTGAGAGQIGTTNTQIQSFIRGELTADCALRPTYVVLLGNTDAVPTFIQPCTPGQTVAQCDVATDLPYSLDGVGSDLFADVMLGRIPATSPQNAVDVVNKIVNYENTMPAPDGDDFYKHATVTGYFQPQKVCVLNAGQSGTPNCNSNNGTVTGHLEIVYSNHRDTRGFTKTSDRVIRAMQADSYTVDRLWTTDDSKVTPEQYYDSTNIPSSLRRPAFAWDADTEDFLNAYNGGRFLIFHRDHGWTDGWAAPTLSSDNIGDLNNGTKLPVVFGVNCSSAQFDIPGNPSFVEEQIEKASGGAVAGFGDTRVSPSFPNNHMALGFFDALFPQLEPSFGNSSPTRRLGDVLLSGKAFMASQDGLDFQGSGDTYFEHQLYHLLGDPSMQMWAAAPVHFDLAAITSVYHALPHPNPGDPQFQIEVTLPTTAGGPPPPGTVLTLLHDGEPVGRATVGADGKATIVPDQNVDANNLRVALDQDGALPAQDQVDRDAAPKEATSITLDKQATAGPADTPRTFTGHLEPVLEAAQVRVVYTSDSTGEKIEHTVKTDASSNFSDTITFTSAQKGRWKVQAFYDGDLGHEGSSSNVLQISVT